MGESMSHIFFYIATAMGIAGGILGTIGYIRECRRRYFMDYVDRREIDRDRLSGSKTKPHLKRPVIRREGYKK